MGATIHPLGDKNLVRGERAVTRRAQRVDVEGAGTRVGDLPVDEAVVGVTGLQRALRDRCALGG